MLAAWIRSWKLLALGFGLVSGVLAADSGLAGRLLPARFSVPTEVAVVRQEPNQSSPVLQELAADSPVMVYPDHSPPDWWAIRLTSPDSEQTTLGFVPRSLIRWAEGPFTDVPGDHWAAPALSRLRDLGELTGDSGGEFRGEDVFTRYQLAVLLDRAMKRLQDTRRDLQDQMAELPARLEEAAELGRKADQLVPRLQALDQEEALLRSKIAELEASLDLQDRRIEEVSGEVEVAEERSQDQDRRLEELASVTEKLTREIQDYRRRQSSLLADSDGGLELSLQEAEEELEKLSLRSHLTLVRLEFLEEEKETPASF